MSVSSMTPKPRDAGSLFGACTAKRYLRSLAIVLSSFCVLSVMLTIAVDPYCVFATPRIPGFNQYKPAAYHQAAMAKSYLMEANHPRTLLLGNSRVEVGLDPDSAAWPASMRPVFNAGLSGRGLDIAAKILEDALAEPGLTHVLVGVDFIDFLQPERPVAIEAPVDAGPDADRARLLPNLLPNPARSLAWLKDRLVATLTLGAVADSLATVWAQHSSSPTTLMPNGFNPLLDYHLYARTHGFRALFDQKQAQYKLQFPHYPHPEFAEPYLFDSFRALREIITVAHERHLDLTLIIYPYHAWMMDLFRENRLLDSFSLWKQALVQSVGHLDPEVRIFDFSGNNPLTAESVPAPGDKRTSMNWYWEPGHFRPSLGDKMIARIYGGEDTGFGNIVSSNVPTRTGMQKGSPGHVR